MSTQNDIILAGATLITVGLSAIVKVAPTAFSFGYNLRVRSGTGTCEIVNSPQGASLSGIGATGWGGGYALGPSEAVTFDGPATFFLAASGTTMVIQCLLGKTAGASYY